MPKEKKTTPRNVIFQLHKIKGSKKILKEAGVGQGEALTNKGAKKRITSDSSSDTIQARREWSEIFKVLREKKPNLEFCNL